MFSPIRLRSLAAVAVVGILGPTASAQIDYSLSFDVDERTWSVEARIPNPGKEDFDYWIPRWTAGAYHLADFGRFVTELETFDGEGNEVASGRVGDTHFNVCSAGLDTIVVRYQAKSISRAVFSENVIDVESNRITDRYAYVTPVSLFGFVPGRTDEPITLSVALPEGWEAATALERDDEGVFHAPDFMRFEDSPLLFGPDMFNWDGEVAGKPLGVTVLGKSEAEAREVADVCVKVVEAAAELMGGLPYTHYRFLFGFVPEGSGSGLEHSFSTLILLPTGMPPAQVGSITAHEFYHLWCAERIHVEAIHDPDYTKGLETSTLWVNEGITEYITRHILLHSGLETREQFLTGLTSGKVPRVAPEGSTWTDVSRTAQNWTEGQGIIIWVLAMYQQGPRTIFGLDLEMRRASNGETGVIDLMRHMVTEYVDKDRGFPEGGMVEIIDEVSGGDLGSYYERFIDGPETPNLGDYLDVIGYELVDEAVREVESPTEAQLRARADFFSIPDAPVE